MKPIYELYGYTNYRDFMIKFFLPVYVLSLLSLITLKILYPENPQLYIRIPIAILLLFLSAGPLMKTQRIRTVINKELPFFITFLHSLSTIHLNRSRFFDAASEAEEYGMLSKIMGKIRELALKWRLGFAEATKRISKSIPSNAFREFLDRLSASIEFGEDFESFFDREERAIMELYEVEYKKSLENAKVVQEVFASVSISLAFIMIVVLFLPMFAQYDINRLVVLTAIAFVIIDSLMVLMYKFLVVDDKLLHSSKHKPEELKQLRLLFASACSLAFTIFLMTHLRFPQYPFLFKLTLALTPLAYVGYRALQIDNIIRKKENVFPAFIGSFGTALGVRGTSQIKALESIRIHDFGPLNEHIEDLYKRMKSTLEYEKSWYFFSSEIGSRLVSKFSMIFARTTRLGANSEKVAKIILENFTKMLDLRKFRLQIVSSMRGMFYGSFVGFVATLFIGSEIMKFIINLFSSLSSFLTEAGGLLEGLLTFNVSYNPQLVNNIIQFLTVIHAIIMSFTLKDLEGGNYYGMFLDMIIFLWLGTLIAVGIPMFLGRLFAGGI